MAPQLQAHTAHPRQHTTHGTSACFYGAAHLVQVQRTEELISSEPRAPGAPSRTMAHQETLGRRGKGRRRENSPRTSRRRRISSAPLRFARPFPAPSPFPGAVGSCRRRRFALSLSTTRNTRVPSWVRIPEDGA
jgi:hypothetical protein